MATNTLAENVEQAITDFDSIKAAIESADITVPSGTPTSDYGDLIEDVRDNWEYAMTNGYTKYANLFEGKKYLTSLPKLRHTGSITDFTALFSTCNAVKSIPQLDTSNGTNFTSFFKGCYSLESIPIIDTSNGTNFKQMFSNCYNNKVLTINHINTSRGTNFFEMFYNSNKVKYILNLDTRNGTDFTSMFYGCSALLQIEKINITKATTVSKTFQNCNNLTTINFEGQIKINGLNLQWSTNLSIESLRSIISALVDKSRDTSGTIWTVTVGSTNHAKLTDDDLENIESKGWVFL